MKTPEIPINADLTKEEAIRLAVTTQVGALLADHFDDIVKSAEETFRQVENQGEIEAKVAFGVTFYPAKKAPKVSVKVSWSTKYSDESEVEVDQDQAKLPLK